jgi:hypothetical protein
MLASAAAGMLAAGCASVHAAPPPSTSAPGQDQCGAGVLQRLVGRGHGEIPPAEPGRARRVYSTEDAVTMDYSPQRLNIVYDARTHRVVRVFCG